MATEGTYVYYDHEAMMGIILLEYPACGAVIGETWAGAVGARLACANVASRVPLPSWFERRVAAGRR